MSEAPEPVEFPPVDPDAPEPRTPQEHGSLRRECDVLLAIAVGGVIGAESRYGIDRLLPTSKTGFPWATLTINVLGCLLMGMLMVVLTELIAPHRLARPFLGIGILGGFTTFSSFTVDAERLIHAHRAGLALAYVVGTLVVAALRLGAGDHGRSTGRAAHLGRGPDRDRAGEVGGVTVLLIALGAAVGAPLRYIVDRAVRAWHDTTFPWGTLTVNVSASLVLGFLAGSGAHVSSAAAALVGTGFCGALSTYSTFGYENQQLVVQRARFDVVANVAVSIVAGVGAAALGWSLGLSVS